MPYKLKPTLKQRLAIGHLISNGGNVFQAMVAAGYSPATAKTAKKLTASSSFQELLEEFLPDSMLLEALHDDIEAKPKNRHKELDLAFKVKGTLSPDKPTGPTYNTQINVNDNTPRGEQMVEAFTSYMLKSTLPKAPDEPHGS